MRFFLHANIILYYQIKIKHEVEQLADDFKWTNAAYHTMSTSAIQQLIILYELKGQVYDQSFKRNADNKRRVLNGQAALTTGKLSSIETYITAFEQQGWTQRIEKQPIIL